MVYVWIDLYSRERHVMKFPASIIERVKLMREARMAYYNTDKPIMTDADFDELENSILRDDPSNSVFHEIGAPVVSEWKKANHDIPMGSLSKVKTQEEFINWAKKPNIKLENYSAFLTEKLDGLSIEVKYIRGKFVSATTRGNGLVGDEITSNVIKMCGVKRILPEKITGSLRGEIILRHSNHKKYYSTYENPRNAASGISKRLDGVGSEHLDILFYDAILEDIEFASEYDKLNYISKTLGLQTPAYIRFDKEQISNVLETWKQYQEKVREKLDYDIDGLVIRIDDIPIQLALGYEGSAGLIPNGAIAFKFPSEQQQTVIKAIISSVGNTGIIGPVAEFEPVRLCGATVSRASLYNMAYIAELGIDVGATVTIIRANDVIPRIESVDISTGTIWKAPKQCPVCGSDTTMRGEFLVCTNSALCPAQVSGRIKTWVSTLNLLEWGDTLIERLVQSGKVKTVADLYKLTEEDLLSIERMGAKSAKKVLEILHSNKEIPIEKFLGGLSFSMVGETVIGLLTAAGYDTIEKIRAMKMDDLTSVSGIGVAKACSIYKGMTDYCGVVDELLSLGVKIKQRNGVLKNKTFCFTGSMKNKRPVLEKMVDAHGGTVRNSVSKGLDFLVAADQNTTKAAAAKKHGTKCISEDDFLEMIK